MANDLFGQSLEYFGKLKSEGSITSYEPVLLSMHGGSLNGFFLVRGHANKLHEVRESEEFRTFVTRADIALKHVSVLPVYLGQELAKTMSIWQKAIKNL